MELTIDSMYQAIVDKDPRFEGTFITAVKTTGIFCRPTCTAKKPKRENVEFFRTTKEAILASSSTTRMRMGRKENCRGKRPGERRISAEVGRVVPNAPNPSSAFNDLRSQAGALGTTRPTLFPENKKLRALPPGAVAD